MHSSHRRHVVIRRLDDLRGLLDPWWLRRGRDGIRHAQTLHDPHPAIDRIRRSGPYARWATWKAR